MLGRVLSIKVNFITILNLNLLHPGIVLYDIERSTVQHD